MTWSCVQEGGGGFIQMVGSFTDKSLNFFRTWMSKWCKSLGKDNTFK